jgi:hypothetical protein
MARNIVQRESNAVATQVLKIMGIEMVNGELKIKKEPNM